MRVKNYLPVGLLASFLLLPKAALAHCPLCTIGVGAAAVGARYLGVHDAVLGVFIGAFAVAMGWWISNWLKKEYIPHQRWILVIASFLLTVIPLLPMFPIYSSIYISLTGGYGTLLNRTYLINLFFVGSLIGGSIVAFTPWLSGKITEKRGKTTPFQGIILTLALIVLAGAIIQVVV